MQLYVLCVLKYLVRPSALPYSVAVAMILM